MLHRTLTKSLIGINRNGWADETEITDRIAPKYAASAPNIELMQPSSLVAMQPRNRVSRTLALNVFSDYFQMSDLIVELSSVQCYGYALPHLGIQKLLLGLHPFLS